MAVENLNSIIDIFEKISVIAVPPLLYFLMKLTERLSRIEGTVKSLEENVKAVLTKLLGK